jgi:hypothetical protein
MLTSGAWRQRMSRTALSMLILVNLGVGGKGNHRENQDVQVVALNSTSYMQPHF